MSVFPALPEERKILLQNRVWALSMTGSRFSVHTNENRPDRRAPATQLGFIWETCRFPHRKVNWDACFQVVWKNLIALTNLYLDAAL